MEDEQDRLPEPLSFTELTNRAASLLYLNLLWLLFCIPVVTIGPATAALYTAVRKGILRDGAPIQLFLREFTGGLRAGMKAWLPVLLALVLSGWNTRWLWKLNVSGGKWGALWILFAAVFALAWLTGMYLSGLRSRFDIPAGEAVRSAFLLTLAHPLGNLLILVLTVLLLVFAAVVPWLLLIMPAVLFLLFVRYEDRLLDAMTASGNQ